MSLDIDLIFPACKHCHRGEETICSLNITHNLNVMAIAAGCYMAVWRPEEIAITKASQMIKPLEKGLKWLQENKKAAKKYEPDNGWGTYDNLVAFLKEYLANCRKHPNTIIRIDR